MAHSRHRPKPASVGASVWSKACVCVDSAYELLGPGWWHVSDDVRWGLVAAQVLAIVNGQDESVKAASVRDLSIDLEQAARLRLRQMTGGTDG